MKTALERWAYQRTLSIDDFELMQKLYDWATDVHDYAVQLKAENKKLKEYYEASQAVERGVIDFDLQHEAVERLRKATKALGDK